MTYSIALKFTVCANVEQPAGGIIRASTESIAIGKELDGVDVRVMSSKCLTALLLSDIPQLSERIASSRHELVVVERIYAQAHDVAQVVCELGDLLPSLDIPQHTGHVTRRGEDPSVVDESAAGQVARVPAKLPGHPCGTFSCAQVVDGANVVETTACHIVATGRIRAGHDP